MMGGQTYNVRASDAGVGYKSRRVAVQADHAEAASDSDWRVIERCPQRECPGKILRGQRDGVERE